MSKKEAERLMFFLWHQGYLKSNITEDHSDYDAIVKLMSTKKITEEFIKDLIYDK